MVGRDDGLRASPRATVSASAPSRRERSSASACIRCATVATPAAGARRACSNARRTRRRIAARTAIPFRAPRRTARASFRPRPGRRPTKASDEIRKKCSGPAQSPSRGCLARCLSEDPFPKDGQRGTDNGKKGQSGFAWRRSCGGYFRSGIGPRARARRAGGEWWSRGESNPWPRHCERRALPTELLPHIRGPQPRRGGGQAGRNVWRYRATVKPS